MELHANKSFYNRRRYILGLMWLLALLVVPSSVYDISGINLTGGLIQFETAKSNRIGRDYFIVFGSIPILLFFTYTNIMKFRRKNVVLVETDENGITIFEPEKREIGWKFLSEVLVLKRLDGDELIIRGTFGDDIAVKLSQVVERTDIIIAELESLSKMYDFKFTMPSGE